jgi:hypothetical protein
VYSTLTAQHSNLSSFRQFIKQKTENMSDNNASKISDANKESKMTNATYVSDLDLFFQMYQRDGHEIEEVKRVLVELMDTEKGKTQIYRLFSMPVIKLFLQQRSEESEKDLNKAMEFLRLVCPFQEPVHKTSTSSEEEETIITQFLRTFHTKEGKPIVPHALSHKNVLKEKTPEAWTKGCEVWKVLATLTFQSFGEDMEKNKQTVREVLTSRLPFPHEVMDINVQVKAPYVRIGDINVGIVIKALETPVCMEMASGLIEDEMMLMTRHGGTTLYPFVERKRMITKTLPTTSSIVVTGWISGDGSTEFQAGTMYTGNHLPGRGPKDIYGAFWKSYPPDQSGTMARLADFSDFMKHTGPYQALIVDI